MLEVPAGFEPAHKSFADSRLTTWLRYQYLLLASSATALAAAGQCDRLSAKTITLIVVFFKPTSQT